MLHLVFSHQTSERSTTLASVGQSVGVNEDDAAGVEEGVEGAITPPYCEGALPEVAKLELAPA
jgi:hypothetical protein